MKFAPTQHDAWETPPKTVALLDVIPKRAHHSFARMVAEENKGAHTLRHSRVRVEWLQTSGILGNLCLVEKVT